MNRPYFKFSPKKKNDKIHRCKACQHKNLLTAKFCGHCGAILRDTETVHVNPLFSRVLGDKVCADYIASTDANLSEKSEKTNKDLLKLFLPKSSDEQTKNDTVSKIQIDPVSQNIDVKSGNELVLKPVSKKNNSFSDPIPIDFSNTDWKMDSRTEADNNDPAVNDIVNVPEKIKSSGNRFFATGECNKLFLATESGLSSAKTKNQVSSFSADSLFLKTGKKNFVDSLYKSLLSVAMILIVLSGILGYSFFFSTDVVRASNGPFSDVALDFPVYKHCQRLIRCGGIGCRAGNRLAPFEKISVEEWNYAVRSAASYYDFDHFKRLLLGSKEKADLSSLRKKLSEFRYDVERLPDNCRMSAFICIESLIRETGGSL